MYGCYIHLENHTVCFVWLLSVLWDITKAFFFLVLHKVGCESFECLPLFHVYLCFPCLFEATCGRSITLQTVARRMWLFSVVVVRPVDWHHCAFQFGAYCSSLPAYYTPVQSTKAVRFACRKNSTCSYCLSFSDLTVWWCWLWIFPRGGGGGGEEERKKNKVHLLVHL